MARKRTRDPFDDMLPGDGDTAVGTQAPENEIPAPPANYGNEKIFVELSTDLVARMKRVIYWDRWPSKKSFIEDALLAKAVEAEEANGRHFDPTPEESAIK